MNAPIWLAAQTSNCWKILLCLLHCRFTKNANIYSLNGSWVQFHSRTLANTLGYNKNPKIWESDFGHFSANSYNWNQNTIAQFVCCENLWPMSFVRLKLDQIAHTHTVTVTPLGSKFCSTFERDCSQGACAVLWNRWWCAKFKFKLLAKKLLTPVVRDRQISSVVVWLWARNHIKNSICEFFFLLRWKF